MSADICPIHDRPLILLDTQVGQVLACPGLACSYSRPVRASDPRMASHAPVAQNKGMEPCAPKKSRKQVVARPAEKEEDIQQAIIQALRLNGYDVRQTTVRLRRCPKCGAPPAGHYGSDKGIADLLIWLPHIQGWRMLECKGPKTAVSPEQKQSALDGKMAIARSVEQALTIVEGWKS